MSKNIKIDDKKIEAYPNSLIIIVDEWENGKAPIEETGLPDDNFMYKTNGEILIISHKTNSYDELIKFTKDELMTLLEEPSGYIVFSDKLAQELIDNNTENQLMGDNSYTGTPWLKYEKAEAKHFFSLDEDYKIALKKKDDFYKQFYIAPMKGSRGHNRHCSDPKKGGIW